MKKTWLIAFNLLTLLAWILFFSHSLLHGLEFDKQSMLMLAFAQGLAVFEVLNCLLKLSGTNWLLTTLQVSSRLLVVAILWYMPWQVVSQLGVYSGFSLITVAWSITEIVRALFYLTGLFEFKAKTVLWMRYTFFIVLYPIGVLGEFMVMFSFIEWRQFSFDLITTALAVVACMYLVYFPKLYMYMFRQRGKKLT